MNWTSIYVLAAALAVYLIFKRSGQISAKDARAYLRNGALIVDVRTAQEFSTGHLSNALNLPLDQIEAALSAHVTGKNQVILLHCQSGMRSGIARKKLLALGYTSAFNLGSYSRARQIVDGR